MELQDLVAGAVGAASDGLSQETKAAAALVIADTIAAIVSGSRYPEVVALAESHGAATSAHDGDASILLTSRRYASPSVAALVHGTAGCWEELDSGSILGGHPAVHVLPAVLGVAQVNKQSGAELLRAFTVGYEVVSRLFAQMQIRTPVHPHGHVGAIGAAVGVAMLHQRGNEIQAAEIAATLPILTTWDSCFAGASARNLVVGMASAAGVSSANAARSGFRAAPEAVRTFPWELIAAPALLGGERNLNEHKGWAVESTYFKFDGACWLAQSAVQAARSLGRLQSEEIADVEVIVAERSAPLVRQPAAEPLSQRFSIPYLVALTLLRGEGLAADAVLDPEAHQLMAKVRTSTSPSMVPSHPAAFPAAVSVVTTKGERLSASVDVPIGHPQRGPQAEAVYSKFHQLVGAGAGDGLLSGIIGLEDHPDVSQLFE